MSRWLHKVWSANGKGVEYVSAPIHNIRLVDEADNNEAHKLPGAASQDGPRFFFKNGIGWYGE